MLQPFKALVHNITADNGLEFADHERIAEELDTDVYFADPYASYQPGANENANGLLRQYVPKGTDLHTVTNKLMAKYQQRLNLRPRKTLGFIQPDIIFKEQLQQAMSECLRLLVESGFFIWPPLYTILCGGFWFLFNKIRLAL